MIIRDDLRAAAIDVLKENDRGSYTVPTKGPYPLQWNWESCFTALGQSHHDLDRAWTEIETLMESQWADGMVPHLMFHEAASGSFPGPDVWDPKRERSPTSGNAQLPIAGFAVNELWKRSVGRTSSLWSSAFWLRALIRTTSASAALPTSPTKASASAATSFQVSPAPNTTAIRSSPRATVASYKGQAVIAAAFASAHKI